MNFDIYVGHVLMGSEGGVHNVQWRVELSRLGSLVAGVTDGDLGEAFKEAYLAALQVEIGKEYEK